MSKLINLGIASVATRTQFPRCRASKVQDAGTPVSTTDSECTAGLNVYCVISDSSSGVACTQ